MAATDAHLRIVRLWRSKNPAVLAPLQHRCSAQNCNVTRLIGFACSKCGVSLTRGCPACSELQNSFICTASGFDHLCGPACALARSSGRCPISKQRVQSADAPPRPRQPAHAARTRTRASDSNFAWNIVHALLFSTRRVAFEKHRRHGLRVAAERAVHRYVRRQQQLLRPVNFVDMACTYTEKYARCKSLEHLRLAPDKRRATCTQYTDLVTQLMTSLNLNILPNVKPDAIATVLLYTLRTGIYVRDEELMPICPFLIKALPDAHCINQLLVLPVAFTQTKNCLFKVFQRLPGSLVGRVQAIFADGLPERR